MLGIILDYLDFNPSPPGTARPRSSDRRRRDGIHWSPSLQRRRTAYGRRAAADQHSPSPGLQRNRSRQSRLSSVTSLSTGPLWTDSWIGDWPSGCDGELRVRAAGDPDAAWFHPGVAADEKDRRQVRSACGRCRLAALQSLLGLETDTARIDTSLTTPRAVASASIGSAATATGDRSCLFQLGPNEATSQSAIGADKGSIFSCRRPPGDPAVVPVTS